MDKKILLRYKNIIAVIIVILVAIVVDGVIYLKYLEKKEATEREKEELNKKLSLAKRINIIDRRLKKIDKKFLHGDVLDFKKSVEKKIEDLNKNYSISVLSLKPELIETGKFYKKARLSLQLACNYKALVELIKKLEEMSSLEIENLSIIKSEGDFPESEERVEVRQEKVRSYNRGYLGFNLSIIGYLR